MANPFLMTEEESMPEVAAYSNPFLIEADDVEEDGGMSENPFFGQATNPFAAFGDAGTNEYEVPVTSANTVDFFGATNNNPVPLGNDNIFSSAAMTGNTEYHMDTNAMHPENHNDTSMSFFDTTIDDEEDNVPMKPTDLGIDHHHHPQQQQSQQMQPQPAELFDDHSNAYSSEDELKGKRVVPPPRPQLPSQATQQLISSIANHLDQTSTHLLGRLPKTRTPSPVSMRDLHSPSPTPDTQIMGDLLGGYDTVPGKDNQFYDSGAIEELPFDNVVPAQPQSENPFEMHQAPEPVKNVEPVRNGNGHQPSRPPPPRPTPPRPPQMAPPPARVEKPVVPQEVPAATPEPDLFDIFDNKAKTAPQKPPPPKTTQDILSLFSTPKQPVVTSAQPDLMSDDVPDFEEPAIAQQQEIAQTHQAPAPPAAPFIPQRQPIPTIEEDLCPDRELTDSEKSFDKDDVSINSTDSYQPTPIEVIEPEPVVSDNSMSMGASDNNDVSMGGGFDVVPPQETTEPIEVHNPFADSGIDDFSYNSAPTPAPVPAPVPQPIVQPEPVASVEPIIASHYTEPVNIFNEPDEFDAFAAKFEGTTEKSSSGFMNDMILTADTLSSGGDAWGGSSVGGDASSFSNTDDDGFGNDDGFDTFMSMKAPESTPFERSESRDSDEAKEFNVFIRPKEVQLNDTLTPALAPPPPRSPQSVSQYSGDSSPRFNPFDKGFENDTQPVKPDKIDIPQLERSDSQETPPTPLFDDDVSQPLEDFPRVVYSGEGWEMQLRQPNKKKITGQRFWKKIFIRLVFQNDCPVLQLFNSEKDKDAFQELPLQGSYSVSEISAQQFDQFGKIFTIKLQYVFYKERPGVRPGQVTKAERLTNKLSQFAAYAIQGDYQGVKELGSDLKKLGLPVEHAPQVSQLFKLGSMSFEDMKQFSMCIEEALFKLNVHRDRALTYKTEEVQITVVDELYVEQEAEGHILKQIARVRLFFLAFMTGMPDIELGVNDLWRQGKEVVGRHDIIPVVTEEWIRLEGVEFHASVQQEQYEKCRLIKFKPPDGCYIELMRFRVRPPKNRELPLQLKATWCVTGNKVELRADVLVPGFASRKLGQIPCEDVAIRFPIPECWIYLFRVEKHFRYGSVKSAHRRTGKIKGIERFLGTVETLQESLIEVTSGQAKYEHHHRAIVWRCSRLPKEGQGAYTTHQLVCRMALTSYDQIPAQLAPYAFVEFTMPATQVSHTTVRSVSVQESDSDEPPEKYVRYLARHEYRVGIEHTTSESTNPYLAATAVSKPAPIKEEAPQSMATTPVAPSDSDSDSN